MSVLNPPPTNAELLNRYVRAGDAAAFTELVGRTGPMVFAVASRETRRPEDAEDVTQIVFTELAKRAGTIEDAGAVGGWLHTVTMRTAARLRRRGGEAALAVEPADAGAESDLDRLARQSDVDALNEELGRLPGSWREPLLLRYFAGCSNEESAARLGLTEKAVEGRLKRGRNTLRVRLLRRGVQLSVATAALEVASRAAAASTSCDWPAAADAALELSSDAAADVATPVESRLIGPGGGRAAPVALAAAAVLFGLSPGGPAAQRRPRAEVSTAVVDAVEEPAEAIAATLAPVRPAEQTIGGVETPGEPRRVEIGLRNAPLPDVAALFSDVLGRPVEVDEASFEAHGRSPLETVTTLYSDTTPEAALQDVVTRRLSGVTVQDAGDRLVISAGGPLPEGPDFFGSAVEAGEEDAAAAGPMVAFPGRRMRAVFDRTGLPDFEPTEHRRGAWWRDLPPAAAD